MPDEGIVGYYLKGVTGRNRGTSWDAILDVDDFKGSLKCYRRYLGWVVLEGEHWGQYPVCLPHIIAAGGYLCYYYEYISLESTPVGLEGEQDFAERGQ
jgi:hypothetical protein